MAKAKRGGQTKYTKQIAAEVCRRLAECGSLRKVCRGKGMPAESTVREWVLDDREGFAAQYAKAHDLGVQVIAEDMIEIADTTQQGTKTTEKPNGVETTTGDMIEHRKLRVDVRKWYLSKIAPKRYGERVAMQQLGKDGTPVDPVVPVINMTIEAAAGKPKSGA